MKKCLVLLAAVALSLVLAPTVTFAQQPPPRPGPDYHGGPPPNHPPPDMVPPQWHRGDRLAPEYRDRQYVIDDWRQYHLKAPPRGYHWVGVSGQYYLVRNSSWVVEAVGP
jgi:nickel/cobalt homeostasis protein